MSWLFSQALVAAYSEANSSDGKQSAPSSGTPMPQAYCAPDKMTAFSRHSQFGMTFKPSTEIHGEELLMWFREAFLAKTSAVQEREQESTESVAQCGDTWHESFARYDLVSRSWKTPQCSLLEDLDKFSETWPRWGTMRNGECSEELMQEFPRAETVYGLLETQDVPQEYLIKQPSMIGAIERDWMQLATSEPTLTCKIRGRAPCPYWETNIGPRYLTEGESEALMGWPIGWSAKKPLATDRFQSWLRSHLNC